MRGSFSSEGTAKFLASLSHGAGIHPNLKGVPERNYRSVIAQHAREFEARYGVRPEVVRGHHIKWQGYVDMAGHQAAAGLGMNLDYITLALEPRGNLGFMTSSGLAMRFSDERGILLPIFQQATQIDDHVFLPKRFGYKKTNINGLISRSKALMELGMKYHVPVTANHHPAWWVETDGRWQKEIISFAKKWKIPVWGADEWLGFLRARRQTIIVKTQKGFRAIVPDRDVTLMLARDGREFTFSQDDKPIDPVGTVVLGGKQFYLIAGVAGVVDVTSRKE